MSFEKISVMIAAIALAIFIFYSRGNISQVLQKSRNAKQHWKTFALLMSGVALLTYVLIKL